MTSSLPWPATSSPSITEANEKLGPSEVFSMIRNRSLDVTGVGKKPVVVFDLDATLFDNRPRILRILNDIIEQNGDRLPENVAGLIRSIQPENMSYRVTDTLRSVGIDDPGLLDLFFNEWRERFFTNEYVVHDIPSPGAVNFVGSVTEEGISTIYLTGRDTPGMRDGTLQSLGDCGFPFPEGKETILITKPTFEETDLDFKKAAIARIRTLGTVISIFDNEPKMTNLLVKAFPEALNVFLDTMHSPDFEPLEKKVVIMKDFRL